MNRREFSKRFALTASGLLIPSLSDAQIVLRGGTLSGGRLGITLGGGGGGGSTYAFVNSATANDISNPTTTGFDTTGCKLITISMSWFGGTDAVSDSKGNTWTALTKFTDSSGNYNSRIYYCINPTVGASHTFSATAAGGGFIVINVHAFSYTGSTPSFDAQNGLNHNATTVTSWQPGSVTPAGNNEVFITCSAWNAPGSAPVASIDSSFIGLIQSQQGTNNLFGGASYKIQTMGGAENPTWTFSQNVNDGAASIAAFK